MGRPARNHGGTGGHGCLPLPGERPNFNHHILDDKKLQKLVQNSNRKQGRSTKLELLRKLPGFGEKPKWGQTDKSRDSVIKKPLDLVKKEVSEKVHSGKSSVFVGINDPMGENNDKLGDSVSINNLKQVKVDKSPDKAGIKDYEKAQSVDFKKTKSIHNDSIKEIVGDTIHVGSVSIKVPKEDQIGKPGNSVNINGLENVQVDMPTYNAGIKDPEMAQSACVKNMKNDTVRMKKAKLLKSDSPSASLSIKEPSEDDKPVEFVSVNQLKEAQTDKPTDNADTKDPVKVNSENLNYSGKSNEPIGALSERPDEPIKVCISDPNIALSKKTNEVQVPEPSHSSEPEPLAPAPYVFAPLPQTYLTFTYFPVFPTIIPTEMPTNCKLLFPSQHMVQNNHSLPYRKEEFPIHPHYPFSIMNSPNSQMNPQKINDQFPVLFNLDEQEVNVDSKSGPCHFNSNVD